MSESKRIYQIDLFRFIAASAVVLYHYLYRGYAAGNMSLLGFDGVGEYFKYGYLGVDLFFIISGFVIAFSIKHLSLRKFCYSRFKRLYPMYWICLLLTFIVSYFWGAPRYHVTFTQLLANLTMVQKLWGQGDVDGAYWSLYVELKFYLIIALFLILNRFKKISLDYLVYFWLLLSSLRFFVGPSEIYDAIHEFFYSIGVHTLLRELYFVRSFCMEQKFSILCLTLVFVHFHRWCCGTYSLAGTNLPQ
jgi:peptidoglycan/LPS O-acetylase OafA/YrhL